ncbi:MAG: RES domain-containing protein, partial [Hyphomicrobiales bacterium]
MLAGHDPPLGSMGRDMKTQDEIDDLKAKVLCFQCVGEDYLRAEILASGAIAECSYCGEHQESYTIGVMAERIAHVFGEHFRRTSTEPNFLQDMMHRDKELDYSWDRDGEQAVYAIGNAAQIEEEPANDIQTILEDQHAEYDHASYGTETEFASDAH